MISIQQPIKEIDNLVPLDTISHLQKRDYVRFGKKLNIILC